jgi:molybdopterin synthase catalytic subunit
MADEFMWISIGESALPVAEAIQWATRPDCGAVVSFCGTVRDFSEGRDGVTSLEYETYDRYAEGKLEEVARSARARWPQVGRIALLHRVGTLAVEEVAVVVVVAAPHRGEAFDAARFCIDTLKTTVPLWKRETWANGVDWSVDDCSLESDAVAIRRTSS